MLTSGRPGDDRQRPRLRPVDAVLPLAGRPDGWRSEAGGAELGEQPVLREDAHLQFETAAAVKHEIVEYLSPTVSCSIKKLRPSALGPSDLEVVQLWEMLLG